MEISTLRDLFQIITPSPRHPLTSSPHHLRHLITSSSDMISKKKPFVCLNMASSVDGKITTFEKEKIGLGGVEDRRFMEELRASVDAILIGKNTLLAEDPPLIIRDQECVNKRMTMRGNKQPLNVTLSSNLDIPIEESEFFNCPLTDKLVFTTQLADIERIERLRKYAKVIVTQSTAEGQVDLLQVAELMKDMGIEHLLLEGGGEINFAMLQANLIDEVYLTLCPYIIGGRISPTIFDGQGFNKEVVRKLNLKNCRVGENGRIFLKYEIEDSSPGVEKSTMFRKGFELT